MRKRLLGFLMSDPVNAYMMGFTISSLNFVSYCKRHDIHSVNYDSSQRCFSVSKSSSQHLVSKAHGDDIQNAQILKKGNIFKNGFDHRNQQ